MTTFLVRLFSFTFINLNTFPYPVENAEGVLRKLLVYVFIVFTLYTEVGGNYTVSTVNCKARSAIKLTSRFLRFSVRQRAACVGDVMTMTS